jgi:NADH dehydrogenase/NADH:ubiquinone oxidoreductase subunit G
MINLELRNQSFNHIQSMSADEFSNIELLMSMYQGMGIQSLSVSEINDCIQKGIETIAITAEKISEIPDTTLTTFLPKKETIFNMYNTDNVLRRSKPLQNTKEGLSSK